MSKEYKGIHDVVNSKGFAIHYRAILNMVSYLEVFRCESQYSKAKGWNDFFYVECFRSEDLSIWFCRRT